MDFKICQAGSFQISTGVWSRDLGLYDWGNNMTSTQSRPFQLLTLPPCSQPDSGEERGHSSDCRKELQTLGLLPPLLASSLEAEVGSSDPESGLEPGFTFRS